MAILDSKRSLIIGGGSGIGRETARLFAAEGADVAVADINARTGAESCDIVSDLCGTTGFFDVDVTNKGSVEAAIQGAAKLLGGLDTLVVTPFVNSPPVILGLTEEQWRQQLDVLATGTFFAFQAAIPVMQAQGSGCLLATSSAHFGDYGAMTHGAVIPGYGAGKAAVELLVRTTATLHSPDGIRVNAVQPGFTITPGAMDFVRSMGVEEPEGAAELFSIGMPMGVCYPDEVAEGFLFLASDYASFITGYSLPVDGGSLAGATGKPLG